MGKKLELRGTFKYCKCGTYFYAPPSYAQHRSCSRECRLDYHGKNEGKEPKKKNVRGPKSFPGRRIVFDDSALCKALMPKKVPIILPGTVTVTRKWKD